MVTTALPSPYADAVDTISSTGGEGSLYFYLVRYEEATAHLTVGNIG